MSNTQYQIQTSICICGLDGYERYTHITIVSESDIKELSTLICYINRNVGGHDLDNWFGHKLPETYDGTRWVLDTDLIYQMMKKNFGYEVKDMNLLKKFFYICTPNGANGIAEIKVYKAELINLE